MDILLYLSLIVILTGLTKTQSTVKYGNTVNDGSCMAQYSAMSHSLAKMSEDVEEIKKTLITQSSYVKKKESKYQIFYTSKSWMDADLSCSVLHGHLVSFEESAELDAVRNMITKPCSVSLGFWTDGRDIGNDTWIWRNNGVPIKAEIWQTGEPNNKAGCTHLWNGFPPYTYGFCDYKCTKKMCYICET